MAVSFIVDLNVCQICVEGDSLIVIRRIQSLEVDRFGIGTILEEVKHRAMDFTWCEFVFIPHDMNGVAHGVVMEGRSLEELQYWMEEVPSVLEWLVDRERRGPLTIEPSPN